MPRRNHITHRSTARLSDRYDTDVCFLPHRPTLKYIVVHPLKTIFRNQCCIPGIEERRDVTRFDDELLRLIMKEKEGY